LPEMWMNSPVAEKRNNLARVLQVTVFSTALC
jgi:hypothetical protein